MTLTVSERCVHVAGRSVAQATVIDDGEELRLRITIAGGPVPRAARRDVVRLAFAVPGVGAGREVHACVPLGDAELLDQLSRRLVHVRTRAAGSTCLVDGTTPRTEQTP